MRHDPAHRHRPRQRGEPSSLVARPVVVVVVVLVVVRPGLVLGAVATFAHTYQSSNTQKQGREHMIHCTIVGRLGKDARAIPGATGGASFSVACDHGFGDKRITTWVDVTLWGKRGAGMLERGLLPKGQVVAVRGELWTEDRESKTWVKVNADEVELVGGKPAGSDAAPARKPAADDGIPF